MIAGGKQGQGEKPGRWRESKQEESQGGRKNDDRKRMQEKRKHGKWSLPAGSERVAPILCSFRSNSGAPRSMSECEIAKRDVGGRMHVLDQV